MFHRLFFCLSRYHRTRRIRYPRIRLIKFPVFVQYNGGKDSAVKQRALLRKAESTMNPPHEKGTPRSRTTRSGGRIVFGDKNGSSFRCRSNNRKLRVCRTSPRLPPDCPLFLRSIPPLGGSKPRFDPELRPSVGKKKNSEQWYRCRISGRHLLRSALYCSSFNL